MRVVYPDDSANPLLFRITGVEVDKVMAVNKRREAVEVRSGDRLSDDFGDAVELWIYPK